MTPTPETPCIEWGGCRNHRGYGRARHNGKQMAASRATWIKAHGPIPDDVVVMHLCDNPPCVRLDHLALGTQSDNTRMAFERGRAPQGESHHLAKLTEQDVRDIRAATASVSALARRHGVDRRVIRMVINRKTWKHVD